MLTKLNKLNYLNRNLSILSLSPKQQPIKMSTTSSQFTLSIVDYLVFAIVLVASSVIGIYFARKGKPASSPSSKEKNERLNILSKQGTKDTNENGDNQKETDEYLVGGRNMHWFPLSISFMATYISASSLLGIPAEIYTYGFQYIVSCGALFVSTFFTWYIFIPIFYRLKIVCANEYLELRFSRGVRNIGCIIMSIYMLISLSIGLYGPALAFEAVGGVPLYVSITVTGLVCIFYTTIGGIKAVVWTDCFQAFVMIAGLLVVIIIGVEEVGSIGKIFEKAQQGERIHILNFDPDPRIRNTFWSLIFGVGFTILPAWAVGQQSVQRFQAAKSMKEARLALLWNFPSMLFISLLAMLAGLVIYAVNADCDVGVYGLHLVDRNDQVLPYFIMQKLGHLTGIPGLFMAVLFSSALSTVSSSINGLSALLLEDFIRKIRPNITDTNAKKMSMLLAFSSGLCGIGLSFLISNLGNLVSQISFTVIGTLGSPYLGMFTLGMMNPWSNTKGAYTGFLFGLGTTLWLAIGAIFNPPNAYPKVVHVDGCAGFNSTNVTNTILHGSGIIRPTDQYVPSSSSLASFYSISYLWYGLIGLTVTILFGSVASAIFKRISPNNEVYVDEKLLFIYKETEDKKITKRDEEREDPVEENHFTDDTQKWTNTKL
ncbi:sodium-coupled monocarboxylate transporter 1-like isoform X1 [Clytia hemisphaerica]|uniref:Uncharacterized protein n=1 Tax=Clytia hemisphaerica TaxID=252671 RepID=A0A7M5XPN9_9CNID